MWAAKKKKDARTKLFKYGKYSIIYIDCCVQLLFFKQAHDNSNKCYFQCEAFSIAHNLPRVWCRGV
jgi:hypothetical protein